MSAVVNQDLCDGCGVCYNMCPAMAIMIILNKATVKSDMCLNCGSCVEACPKNAVSLG